MLLTLYSIIDLLSIRVVAKETGEFVESGSEAPKRLSCLDLRGFGCNPRLRCYHLLIRHAFRIEVSEQFFNCGTRIAG